MLVAKNEVLSQNVCIKKYLEDRIWIEFKLKTCICPKKIVWPKSSGTTLRENAILKRFTPLLARTIKEKIL